jgi:hypothetical protein
LATAAPTHPFFRCCHPGSGAAPHTCHAAGYFWFLLTQSLSLVPSLQPHWPLGCAQPDISSVPSLCTPAGALYLPHSGLQDSAPPRSSCFPVIQASAQMSPLMEACSDPSLKPRPPATPVFVTMAFQICVLQATLSSLQLSCSFLVHC